MSADSMQEVRGYKSLDHMQREADRWRWLVEQVKTKETMVRAQALLWNCSGSREQFVKAVDDARNGLQPGEYRIGEGSPEHGIPPR